MKDEASVKNQYRLLIMIVFINNTNLFSISSLSVKYVIIINIGIVNNRDTVRKYP